VSSDVERPVKWINRNGTLNVEHFVLTRFNVRAAGGSTAKIHDSAWLTYRLGLFEEFCLPSVIRQTRLPTAWINIFDVGTPREILAQFEEMIAPYAFIKYVQCQEFTAEFAAECVRDHTSPGCSWIITTRLDNDDAINIRFLEEIFLAASIGTYEFINAPNGLVKSEHRYYCKSDRSNAFISASEPVETCRTVYIDQHTRLSRYAAIKQVPLKYAWLQMIHGDNVANRPRGVRVPRGMVDRNWFPEAFSAEISKESLGEMIADNSVGLAIRWGASLNRWLGTRIGERLKISD